MDDMTTFRLLSEATETQVDWLWEGYLPLGKLVVLDGDGGVGKSTLMYDLAARITTVREMPDGSPGVDGGVVMVEMEDEDGDTILPRIKRMGGDPSRIISAGMLPTGKCDEDGEEIMEPFTLDADGLEYLEEAVDNINAKLLVINPILTVLDGHVDTYKDASVKRALYPLVRLAVKKDVTVVIVRHTNKQGSSNATNLGTASKAFINTARAGLLLTPSPDDGEVRVMSKIKGSYSGTVPNLEFTIKADADKIAYVEWGGVSKYSVAQLIGAVSTGKTYNNIQQYFMENGPTVTTQALYKAFPDMKEVTVRQTLDKLKAKGVVRSLARGEWRLVDVMSTGYEDDEDETLPEYTQEHMDRESVKA